MRVRNLQAWAGEEFNYVAGDEIDLPDDIAQSRIDAGLCEAVTVGPKRKPKTETQEN